MLKDKSSVWGLRFFIDYLIEQDISILPEPVVTPKSDYEIEIEEFGLTEEEIPW